MEEKPTILVVEDEEVLLELIKQKLERENFEVLGVRKANQALQALENEKVDAIWLDHYLIGKDTGLDFVAKVKAHEDWKKTPIFVVSNPAGPEKKQMYMHLGIAKYYVKADYQLDEIIKDIREKIAEKETE